MIETIFGFLSIFLIGCISLIGILMISVKEKVMDNILLILVAFGTGAILATALFSLIPEALQNLKALNANGRLISENFLFISIIVGFVTFFIIERFIYWFHGHAHEKENQFVCYPDKTGIIDESIEKRRNIKGYVYLNLFGDGLHNFLDGMVIMVAFLNGIPIGIIVSLAVMFHELPQEAGDFGILVYGGLTKKKALSFNFLSGMIAMFGGVLALFLSSSFAEFNFVILAFSGGGFLYLACTELMPEIMKQKDLRKSVVQTVIFLIGILLIIALIIILPHE